MQTMELPTKKSQINKKWTAQKILCIGQGGIGKSTFWAQGEKTFFFEFESGLNHLEVFKLPIRTWDDFVEAGALLMKAKNEARMPYDTLVLDTVDRWVDLANEEVVARARGKFKAIEINSVGDVPNGAGWYMATELISNYLAKLEKLDCCVVLIGHLSVKEIKERTGSYHRESISIGGKMGEGFLHWSDHTLFVQATRQGENIKRTVYTKPIQSREGKSRGGLIPDGLDWNENMTENYKNLRGLFE